MEALTLEQLRIRVQNARSQRASLQADLVRMQDAPTAEEIFASKLAACHPLPQSLVDLSKQVTEAEDRCILLRCSAWTVFEIDLEVGRRQREQRMTESRLLMPGKESLGLGVRLDSFYKGRFHEPYYLVFAKASQSLSSDLTKVTDAALDVQALRAKEIVQDDKSGQPASEEGSRVRLIRHTIPPFIPLQELLLEFLGPGHGVEEAKRGGLDLLDGLLGRQGLTAFLSLLHEYLQAYVGRKAQAIALGKLPLPSRSGALEAFSNDRFDRINIVWEIPDVTVKHIILYEREIGIDRSYIDEDPNLSHRLASKRHWLKARKERLEREAGGRKLIKAVQIEISIRDVLSDQIGRVAEESQPNNGTKMKSDDALQCTHGSVRVEIMRHPATKFKRSRRTSVSAAASARIRNKQDDVVGELEYTRRLDLERQFAEPGVTIDRALRHAIEVIWREEVKVASDHEHNFRDLDKIPLSERRGFRASRAATNSPSLLEPDTMEMVE